MSYEHCDEHDQDATNGCPLCILKERRGAMKIIRILEGERYTAVSDDGTGYMSATAVEDGFEIDDRGNVLWITDALLERAIEERNRSMPDESLEDVYDDGELITPPPTKIEYECSNPECRAQFARKPPIGTKCNWCGVPVT
jgi:hypothetical protein